MKRYLVFTGERFYPGGGWEDYKGEADTVADAMVIVANEKYRAWYQIVDTKTKKVVKEKFVKG